MTTQTASQYFILACETYIQFTDEYTDLNDAERLLKRCCEYVKSVKPVIQIEEQFNKLVLEKTQHLTTGIIRLSDTGLKFPGDIFKTSNGAIFWFDEGYKFIFGEMIRSFVGKSSGYDRNGMRKKPSDVMMYMCSLISKAILRKVTESDIDERIKESILANTFGCEVERPYPSRQFNNLSRFMSALFGHPSVASHVGNRESTQAQQVIAGMDFGRLVSNDPMEVMSAFTRRNTDAVVNMMEDSARRIIPDNRLRTELLETEQNEEHNNGEEGNDTIK